MSGTFSKTWELPSPTPVSIYLPCLPRYGPEDVDGKGK